MGSQKLKIFHCNVRSIVSLSKRADLNVFLKKYNPHVMMVCETKLKFNNALNLKNYSVVRRDVTQKNEVGIAILVKNNIEFSNISIKNIKDSEVLGVKLKLSNNKFLNIFSIYSHATQSRNSLISDLNAIHLEMRGEPFMIGGDFNARHPFWGDTTENLKGTAVYRWFLDNSLIKDLFLVKPLLPTFHRNDSFSYIDFFITSRVNLESPFAKNFDFQSDHNAIAIEVFTANTVKPEKIEIPNYSKTDFPKLNSILENKLSQIDIPINRNLSTAEIDSFVEQITQALNQAIEESTPKFIKQNSDHMHLPNRITSIIKLKAKLRRKWFKRRYDPDAQVLKYCINQLSQTIHYEINRHQDK